MELRTKTIAPERDWLEPTPRDILNSLLFTKRTAFARAIAEKIRRESPQLDPRHIATLRALRLGDISEVEIRRAEPGTLALKLHPSKQFPNRNTADWLSFCAHTIYEHVANNMELFSERPYKLRGSPEYRPDAIKLASQAFSAVGGTSARVCEISVSLGEHTKTILCIEVNGGVNRWGSKILVIEAALSQKLGHSVKISPGEIPDEEVRKLVAADLARYLHLKATPRFLKENDDPKSKILHHPVDLRSLTWWAFDAPTAYRREDIQAVCQTPAGPYLLIAVPSRIWSDGFYPNSDAGQVVFCGGLLLPNGEISRMRVGIGLTSKPILVDRDQISWGRTRDDWNGFIMEMHEALRPRLSKTPTNGEFLSFENTVQGAIHCSQEILVSCLLTRAAPFFVWTKYKAQEGPQVLRGDELIPHEHVVPLKARHNGGILNQEQVLRAIELRPPLTAHHFNRATKAAQSSVEPPTAQPKR